MKITVAKTATQALQLLWQGKFFSSWQNSKKIVQQLAKKGNNFTSAELGMALKRASYLTRRGKPGGYEYIQKYQHTEEEKAQSKKPQKKK